MIYTGGNQFRVRDLIVNANGSEYVRCTLLYGYLQMVIEASVSYGEVAICVRGSRRRCENIVRCNLEIVLVHRHVYIHSRI